MRALRRGATVDLRLGHIYKITYCSALLNEVSVAVLFAGFPMVGGRPCWTGQYSQKSSLVRGGKLD